MRLEETPLLRWVGLESVSGRSSNAEYHFMIETGVERANRDAADSMAIAGISVTPEEGLPGAQPELAPRQAPDYRGPAGFHLPLMSVL